MLSYAGLEASLEMWDRVDMARRIASSVAGPSWFRQAPATKRSAGGRVVFEAPKFRVVHAQEAGFPAFYRLVWNTHATGQSN